MRRPGLRHIGRDNSPDTTQPQPGKEAKQQEQGPAVGSCNQSSQYTKHDQRYEQCFAPTKVIGIPAGGDAAEADAQQRRRSEHTRLVEAQAEILTDHRQRNSQQDDFHGIEQIRQEAADKHMPFRKRFHRGFPYFCCCASPMDRARSSKARNQSGWRIYLFYGGVVS
ncbi:hypothetical protein D3C78_1330610 [compost metagenome]